MATDRLACGSPARHYPEPVLILAMDTATDVVAVSLGDEHGLLAGRTERSDRRHNEALAPLIADALTDVDRQSITHIVCGVGPGPFTGLRVGIAMAEVMGHALGIPVVGVCSLDALAHEAWRTRGPSDYTVLTDARRREVYCAHYADDVRLGEPQVLSPGAVQVRGVAVGDGAARYADVLGVTDPSPLSLTAASLHEAARRAVMTGGLPVVPLYLRRPDAMEPSVPS